MKIFDIKNQLGIHNLKLEFVPSERKGLLVFTSTKKENDVDRKYSIYISPKNLKKFKNSQPSNRDFRLVYEYEGDNFVKSKSMPVQITLKNEITDLEWEYHCNTIEQIKNKIGVENFSFKKSKGNLLYHTAYYVGETYKIQYKIWIFKDTLKFITENPKINNLRLEYMANNSDEGNHDLQILLWDEVSIKDEPWEHYEELIRMENAEYESDRFDAMLDDINGDWGGLYDDEANLGEQNCD